MLSALTLGVFILLAAGSVELFQLGLDITVSTDTLADGPLVSMRIISTTLHAEYLQEERMMMGRWHGEVTIVWDGYENSTEVVRMEHGRRQGLSTTTYGDGRKEERHYFDGRCYKFKKATYHIGVSTAAFQVLSDRYPWFLFTLNEFGFEDDYVEAYLDTLETILYTYEFDVSEFDSYYEDAQDVLAETPYDSLLAVQSNLLIMRGLEEMKNAELRLAVIDRYRSEAGSTFELSILLSRIFTHAERFGGS